MATAPGNETNVNIHGGVQSESLKTRSPDKPSIIASDCVQGIPTNERSGKGSSRHPVGTDNKSVVTSVSGIPISLMKTETFHPQTVPPSTACLEQSAVP